VRFEWDSQKAERNTSLHGVSFKEGMTVFADSLARIFDDERHSTSKERREIIVGHSNHGRLLLVSFTERKEETVRIISVRKTTKQERKDYENNV
jgi:uncharacterized DUF497 family protein